MLRVKRLKKTSHIRQLAGFLWSHQFPIGLSFTILTVADLIFIISNVDAAIGSFAGSRVAIPPPNLAIPPLFAISLIGTVILCVYCIRDIQPQRVDYKEHVALLLAALGFTYQVIGAWPLWNQAYPWLWQIEIAKYGNLLVLPLFAVSLLALIAGGVSLYIHSKIYHHKKLLTE
jgi:hypothetical protein